MDTMNKEDIIGIIQGYIGLGFITHWAIWSYSKYGIIGFMNWSYITSFAGLR